MKPLNIRIVLLLGLAILLSVGTAGWPTPSQAGNPYSVYLPVVSNDISLTWAHIGPQGGTVTSVATVPSQPGVIYAGSWGSGVYKTLDGGKTWNLANIGLTNGYIYSLAVDPTNPNIIYAGTFYNGVFKSTDGGATWNPTGPGLNDSAVVYALAINPKQPNIIFAGTRGSATKNTKYCTGTLYDYSGGVFKSSNGGDTWTQVDGGQACGYVYGLAVDPVTPTIVYVATHEHGVLKSTDGGNTFAYMNAGLADLSARSIVIDPTDHTRLFLATWHGSVFIKRGTSQYWNYADSGIVGFHVMKLAIDSSVYKNGCPLIYASTWGDGTGLARSTDCANSWSQVNPGAYALFTYDLAVEPQPSASNGNLYFGLSGMGVYESTNRGSAWASANQGLYNTAINTVLVDPLTPTTLYAGTGCCGIFKSLNNGATWSAADNGLPVSINLYPSILKIAADPSTPGALYAGTDGSGVYRSTNGGALWRASSKGLPAAAEVAPGSSSSLAPHGLAYDALFFEDDNTGTGIQSPVTPPLGTMSYPAILSVPGAAGVLYSGSGSGVFKTTDGGNNWTAAGLSGQQVFSLAIDPTHTATLYAGTTAGIYKTTTGGANWKPVGLAADLIYDLVIDPTNPAVIYACTNGSGIYQSPDGGATWANFSSGLQNMTVYSLAMDSSDSHQLYAGTANGLYIKLAGSPQWRLFPSDIFGAYLDPVVASPTTPLLIYAGTNGGVVTGQFKPGATSP